MFVYELGRSGSEHVVVNGVGGLNRGFKLHGGKVKDVEWMDNGEKLNFTQDGENLIVACTGYPYGTNYCVRVAKLNLD